MRLTTRNGIYYAEYKHRGRRVRESLGTRDEAEAQRLLGARAADIAEGRHVIGRTPTLNALLNAWLERKQRDGQDTSTVESRLKRTRKALGPCKVDEITATELESWQGELLELGLAPGTVNLYMADVRGALNDAAKRGKIPRGILPHFPRLDERNEETGIFCPPEDFSTTLAARPEYVRNCAEYAYLTGRRRGELEALQWADIARDRITWRKTKNRRGIILPITPRMREILSERREKALYEARLVPAVWHREGRPLDRWSGRTAWRKACAAAGLPGLRFHDLRHSAMTNFIERGASLEEAMLVTGHTDRQVALRYAHVRQALQMETLERLMVSNEKSPRPRRASGASPVQSGSA